MLIRYYGYYTNAARGEEKEIGVGESRLKSLTMHRMGEYAENHLIFTEEYKKISFLQKNDLLGEIFEKCAPGLNGMVLLFGSYAKGRERADSDIDILVVGEYDKSRIDAVSRMYGKNISVKKYPQSVFANEMNTDNLLREVLNDHVVLQGLEEFVVQVLKWTK